MGSRANSDQEYIGIKHIKCYFLQQICLQHNSTIHCTDYWRLAKSLLSSIFFCQLLQHFYYLFLSFSSFPIIFGHVVLFFTHVAGSISLFLFVNLHYIGVSSQTYLISFPILHTWPFSPISSTGSIISCSPYYLVSFSSIQSLPYPFSLSCTFLLEHTAFLPSNLSSALLCLWFWSSLIALSCYSSIVVDKLSVFTSFLLIALFNLLNFSIRGLLLQLLPLVTFLNSWTYLSHDLSLCSIVLNCSTFLSAFVVFSNSFLIFVNNSFAISISDSLLASLFNKLSFYASAISSCIYNNTYAIWIIIFSSIISILKYRQAMLMNTVILQANLLQKVVFDMLYTNVCHDLAKRLSHYLYLLYFTFSFGLTIQERVWESVTQSWSHDKKSQHYIT